MARVNPPTDPAELTARQAAGHTDQIRTEWRLIFGPNESYPEDAIRAALAPWLAGHLTRGATREQAAIHEAAHLVAFERVGMIACTAQIYRSRGGQGAWAGTAGPAERAGWSRIWGKNFGGPTMIRGEAIAAMAGPIAEEVIGGGDALSSIGELVSASLWAMRAGELAGQPWKATVSSAVVESISLVEQHAPDIQAIGQVLARRKCISRGDVEGILARVPQGPVVATPLSAAGQALHDEIMGAFEQVWLSAPVLYRLGEALQ